MKSFQKALFSGLSALVATASVSNAQEALGTLNTVQVTATVENARDVAVLTLPGGTISESVRSLVSRLSTKTILTALAADESTGFPSDLGIAGWRLVEAFTQGTDSVPGESLGIFAYKAGLQPVPVPAEYLSISTTDYAESFDLSTFVTDRDGIITKNDHIYKGPATAVVNDMAVTGTAITKTGIKLTGDRQNPTFHTTTVRTLSFSGAETGFYITGQILSSLGSNLVTVQAFSAAPILTNN